MLSGFLMFQTKHSKSKQRNISETSAYSAYTYTWKRIKRFSFHYLLSIFLLMVYRAVTGHWTFSDWLHSFYQYKYELLMLQMGGAFKRINTPVWYISALLLVGFFVYYLLEKNEDFYIGFIAPAGILLSVAYFANVNGGSTAANWGLYNGLLIQGWIRAFMELSLGVLCCVLFLHIKKSSFGGWARVLLSTAEVGCLLFVARSTLVRYTENDIFCCIVFCFLITVAFLETTWFNRLCTWGKHPLYFLGSITYPMLCYQRLVIWIFTEKSGIETHYIALSLYLICTILFSAGMLFIEKKLKTFCFDLEYGKHR